MISQNFVWVELISGTCGILLVMAGYLFSKGKALFAQILFLVMDALWIIKAYSENDMFGTITLSLGLLFGSITLIKMHKGIFVKNLKRKI